MGAPANLQPSRYSNPCVGFLCKKKNCPSAFDKAHKSKPVYSERAKATDAKYKQEENQGDQMRMWKKFPMF
jgi:hypothetical protein